MTTEIQPPLDVGPKPGYLTREDLKDYSTIAVDLERQCGRLSTQHRLAAQV